MSQGIQINHAVFSQWINPFNYALQRAIESGAYDWSQVEGLTALNAEVTRQAATLAYLQDFRFMMWVTLSAFPLLLLLKKKM